MARLGQRFSLKHLGTLRGSGGLSVGTDELRLGTVAYEIDGYAERTVRWASGQIEGSVDLLARAFDAGGARITLAGGRSIDVALSDPEGGPAAEIKVCGPIPAFAVDRHA